MDTATPDAPNLGDLCRDYRAAIDGTREERDESLKARDYKDGRQFTKEQLAVYKRRKQPAIVYNRTRKKVNGMVGFEIARRTDPIAYGRTEASQPAANIASKCLRWVEENISLDGLVTAAFENILVEGTGTVELSVVPGRDGVEIDARHVPWEMRYHDPRSRQLDLSDAAYLGVSEWMHVDEAVTRWGEQHKDKLEGHYSDGLEHHESTEDRPEAIWFDEQRRRVRVVQHWYVKGGDWYFATFTKAGILEHGKSPYVDADGQTWCPLRMRSCYIDRDNRRYGIVRDLFGPQDEINARRSKLLHQVSESPFFFQKGTIDDGEAAKRRMREELRKPDGIIEVNHGEYGKDFGPIDRSKSLQGQAELLQEAKLEMDAQGINPALVGQRQGAASGRAILATQQGAMAEEAPVFDGLREFKLDLYRRIWMLIQQFWTSERTIRVTNDKRAPEYVVLNQQVGVNMYGQPVVKNPPSRMDVDILIEETQDAPTIQAEQFEQFLGLLERVPGLAQTIDPIDILRMSSLPNKMDIIERIEAKQEEAAQQPPDPVQQRAMMVKMAQEEAKARETDASANLKEQQAIKTAAEVRETEADIRKTDAETVAARIEAIAATVAPVAPQEPRYAA